MDRQAEDKRDFNRSIGTFGSLFAFLLLLPVFQKIIDWRTDVKDKNRVEEWAASKNLNYDEFRDPGLTMAEWETLQEKLNANARPKAELEVKRREIRENATLER